MKTRGINSRIAGFTLLLATGLATALPVFTAGWGLNTINGPFDAALIENAPVSGGNSRTTQWPYDPSLEFYTVTASADANRGVVGVLARISVARNTSFQTSRVEAVASMKGTVRLCAPGSASGVCTPPTPGVPVPIPYPNFILTSTHTQTVGNSLAGLIVRVSIGDDAGTLTGVASTTVLGNAGGVNFAPDDGATTGLFTSTGAFPIQFDIGAAGRRHGQKQARKPAFGVDSGAEMRSKTHSASDGGSIGRYDGCEQRPHSPGRAVYPACTPL